MRLDEALVAAGLYASRARARDAVLRGVVRVNGEPARKASQTISDKDRLSAEDEAREYVSRAALKLIHALDHFRLDVTGARALDVGASTGGFTQVLLARGAAHVVALDVGHGQLAESLRADRRVTVMEGFNARNLTADDLPYAPDVIVSDVSFISLTLALAPALQIAGAGARLVALIKPQFEAGREALGKGGIVRDAGVHQAVCADVQSWIAAQGFDILGLEASPVEGGDGNREFLIAARKAG